MYITCLTLSIKLQVQLQELRGNDVCIRVHLLPRITANLYGDVRDLRSVLCHTLPRPGSPASGLRRRPSERWRLWRRGRTQVCTISEWSCNSENRHSYTAFVSGSTGTLPTGSSRGGSGDTSASASEKLFPPARSIELGKRFPLKTIKVFNTRR